MMYRTMQELLSANESNQNQTRFSYETMLTTKKYIILPIYKVFDRHNERLRQRTIKLSVFVRINLL